MNNSSPNPRLRKKFLWLTAALVGLVAFAAWKTRTGTPSFLDVNGVLVPNSISEERTMVLGDVEQHVLLRGKDKTNPLLVFVHGGPGFSTTAFLRTNNAALEDDFVVAYWEQRGTLNSFDPKLDSADMTIEQMTADLSELIDALLAEFGQEQVILFCSNFFY